MDTVQSSVPEWPLFKRLLQTFAMHFDLQLPEILDTCTGYSLDTRFQSDGVHSSNLVACDLNGPRKQVKQVSPYKLCLQRNWAVSLWTLVNVSVRAVRAPVSCLAVNVYPTNELPDTSFAVPE